MNEQKLPKSIQLQSKGEGTLWSYVTGFVLSVAFTITAFVLVEIHIHSFHERLPHKILIPMLAGLALLQFAVQLFFFLHLGRETRPRWKLLALWFMVLVVFILVAGSLWIMYNLNYNMSPSQITTYMNNQDGL